MGLFVLGVLLNKFLIEFVSFIKPAIALIYGFTNISFLFFFTTIAIFLINEKAINKQEKMKFALNKIFILLLIYFLLIVLQIVSINGIWGFLFSFIQSYFIVLIANKLNKKEIKKEVNKKQFILFIAFSYFILLVPVFIVTGLLTLASLLNNNSAILFLAGFLLMNELFVFILGPILLLLLNFFVFRRYKELLNKFLERTVLNENSKVI